MKLILFIIFLHICNYPIMTLDEYYSKNFLLEQIKYMCSNKSDVVIIDNINHLNYLNIILQSKVMIFNNIPDSLPEFNKLELIIFLFDDINKLLSNLKKIISERISKIQIFILYFGRDDISVIFKFLWKFFIVNITVFYENQFYTYYPFKNNFCNNTEMEPLNIDNYNYFPEKIPNDLHNCSVKILAYPMESYVINTNKPNYDDPRSVGLEVTIIRTIFSKMNLFPEFLNHSYVHWGFKYPNGSYSLMYKDLYNKKADVMFGFTYGNSTYNSDFDQSFSHLLDPSVWWVPIASQTPPWKNILAIYDQTLWIIILSTTLIIGFIWWIAGKNNEVIKRYNDLIFSILESFYALLQGSVESPLFFINRLLFLIWIIASLLLCSAYQCKLVSFLTKPIHENQISNLQQLVESKLQIGFYPTVAQGFNESHNWVHEQILNSYIPCPLTNECINRTAYKRDFATFKNQRSGLYLIPKYFTTPDGKSMLFKFEEFGILSVIRYMTVKNWVYLERFNLILTRLQASGLIHKWDRDMRLDGKYIDSQELTILSLNHLLSAFYVLFIGVMVSFIVLIFELSYYKLNK